jgi:type I restriction enzyme S subunit
VELLKEKRSALISHAVTKGLDPDAKMKDSGIPWMGEIPEGWEVSRLKYVSSRITKGTTPSTIGKEFTDHGITFVRVENISDKMTTTFEERRFIDYETHNVLKRSQLKENDVLITIAGAIIGRIAVVKKDILPANTNQAVGVISLISKKVIPKWVAFSLRSAHVKKKYDLMTVKAAQPNLSLEDVGEAIICTPKLSEQKSIAAYLDRETTRIDTLVTKIQKSIDLLNEHRTALISAAVTGKIDLREEIN